MNTTTANPQTLNEIIKEIRHLYTNGTTFEDYKNFKSFLLDQEQEIKNILNKETVQSLSRYTWRKEKKARLVDSVYSTLCQYMTFGDSFMWQPMAETFRQALDRVTSNYTEADFLAYKEKLKAEREAKEKALNNPETLEEFRQFISRKGEAALTQEQREKYDNLTAETRKQVKEKEEQQRAKVEVVQVSAEMIIKESFHAKKQIPLWVVVLSDRVSREKYEELNSKAKKLGGYYSSYKGNGAIPGFTFETQEAAQQFAGLKEKAADITEQVQERKEERQQTRAEQLRKKGQKMQEEGNEELNRDRKDNTHRRATMAANAEAQAAAKITFGKTLVKIANAMETGEIKFLDKLSTTTELETLNNVLSDAKRRHIMEMKLNRDQYQTSSETANFARYPFPIIYEGCKSTLLRLENIPGKKLAAARMLKRLNGADFIEIKSAGALEDYETLFLKPCQEISSYLVTNYKNSLMQSKRLQRIGIETPEELRAALRELISIKKGATIDKEQEKKQHIKQIERSFIGRNIPGFFPTPETLAGKVVRLANVWEGATICEGSAGLGHLADAITEAHPFNPLQCVEIVPSLCEALTIKGYEVVNEDFLKYQGHHDIFILNPPFENLQDIEHVQHAWSLTNEGGRVVAIMANNKHRTPDFLEFVNQYGYFIENEEGAFLSAFRSTGVSTITVILDKPKEDDKPQTTAPTLF